MIEQLIKRRLVAILAADVAGYSSMMRSDEAGTISALRQIWADIFNPSVITHHGRVVKVMGDGALVEFASAVEAVECAVAIQNAMGERTQFNQRPIEFRIGVNLGEVVVEGDDIFGDGVNVATRLEGQAPQGGILVSDAVHSQVNGKVAVTFFDSGESNLKNIGCPVRAWGWVGKEAGQLKKPITSLAAADSQEKPSIAVLPFENLSGDPEQGYFADGITEDIITDLSKVSGLFVIARNSSFAYRGQAVNLRRISRELGVRYVLEGSVRRAAGRVRINAVHGIARQRFIIAYEGSERAQLHSVDANIGGQVYAKSGPGELMSVQPNWPVPVCFKACFRRPSPVLPLSTHGGRFHRSSGRISRHLS